MKRIFTLLIINFCILPIAIGQAYIGNSLYEKLRFEDEGLISINVFLYNQANIDSLHSVFRTQNTPLIKRYSIVMKAISDVANNSQPDLINFIEEISTDSKFEYENLQSFEIINMLSLDANKELILKLADRDDIEVLEENRITLKIEEPVSYKPSNTKSINGVEPGLIAINSHLMWALGYTGKNRIGMNVDTGINYKHPSINRNYLGNHLPLSQCWFPFNNPTPLDISDHSHGTHTIGTMMGIDTLTNDTIGVAYNSFWISSDPIVSELIYLRTLPEVMSSFEWALNPDGDTTTVWDIPDVINNSWGWVDIPDTFQCTSPYTTIMEVCEAVGIGVVWSAGNDGDLGPGSVGEPAHKAQTLVNAFAVGSVNGNISSYMISDFSSLGPTVCADTGSLKIKPEVVAPGQDVRSAMGEDEYGYLSGTSMAGPHVAGALLLLKEAFPYLSGEDLKYALYNTAVDLGPVGEDNTYGKGIIDVFAAYEYLEQSHTPVPPVGDDFDIEILDITNPNFNYSCNQLTTPMIVIKNSGLAISDLNISYVLNDSISFDTVWVGQLLLNEILNFSFPEITVNEGFNSLVFHIAKDSTFVESNIYNNYRTAEFKITTTVDLPFYEDFEDANKLMDNSPWIINNPDDKRTWTIDTIGSWLGNRQGIFMDYYYYKPDEGQIDDLISPIINLPDTGGLELFYSIAYRQRRSWTNDSLKIYVSTDCGLSFPHMIYANGGDSLETYPFNLGNPRFVPNQDDHWRHDTIDISEFIGSEKIMLKFSGINNRGNSIWLDNIGVNSIAEPISISEIKGNGYRIYPNPTSSVLYIESVLENLNGIDIKLINMNGQVVRSMVSFENNYNINVTELNSGIYFIVLNDGVKVSYHKFVKN